MISRRLLAQMSPTLFATATACALIAFAAAAPPALSAAAAGAAKTGAQAAAAPAPAPGASAPAAGAGAQGAQGAHRTELTTSDGQRFPYTIELPAGWQVVHSSSMPGVFVGPAGSSAPETDPRMVYVRVSPASLADPEAVVANIKQSAAADSSWSAPLVEVREMGGVRGVLVRMDSGSGIQARSTLVLKMPFGQASLDFMASATHSEFERQLPVFQKVILSVLPAR